MTSRPRVKTAQSWTAAALLIGAIVYPVRAQTGLADPKELIRILTRQNPGQATPTFIGCGEVAKDRTIARSLVEIGRPALQSLDDAINSLDRDGGQSPFARGAGWILQAYAKILGPSSDPRLQLMANNPKLSFLILDIDAAIAIEQSITSHVSGSQPLANNVDCTRSLEPRHALDQLVLAWQRGDQRWFESSLGPQARNAFRDLLKRRRWSQLKAGGRANGSPHAAIGYRFENAGIWGEPWDTLEAAKAYPPVKFDLRNPKIETEFTTDLGRPCGRAWVHFVNARGVKDGRELAYLVDNPDLQSLIQTISACAIAGEVSGVAELQGQERFRSQ